MTLSRDRLDTLLHEKGLAETRAKAQAMIMAGRVKVDGNRAEKAGQMVSPEANLEVDGKGTEWVSRGAHKLLRGLEAFGVEPRGLVCLDVGASTGGFTDVLLSRGASKVYAVDVGYGQLAWKIRGDPRVVVMERTNARFLTPGQFSEPLDLVVVDASFISLRLLLAPLEELLAADGQMVLLVKPQFEAGKGRVGKGGVVRSPLVHRQVLAEFAIFTGSLRKITLAGLTWSPIKGPSGNTEFLAHLVPRRDETMETGTLSAIIEKTVAGAMEEFSHGPEGGATERENDR